MAITKLDTFPKKTIPNLPDENVINGILKKVHKVCIFGSTNHPANKEEKLTRHFLAFFALQHIKQKDKNDYHIYFVLDWMKKNGIDNFNLNEQVVASAFQCYQNHTNKKEGELSQKDRSGYLLGLILGANFVSHQYGYGNCEPMADLAFLESVMQDLHCPISIVRFDHSSKPMIDEINTVVLGDWPKPGCIILSPSHGEYGETYLWNGDCEKLHFSAHARNRARCIFSPTDEERILIKDILERLKYENWLKDSDRERNLRATWNNFFQSVHETRPFQRKNDILRYLDYKDLLMFGNTSKDNHTRAKEIEKDLKKECERVNNFQKAVLIG